MLLTSAFKSRRRELEIVTETKKKKERISVVSVIRKWFSQTYSGMQERQSPHDRLGVWFNLRAGLLSRSLHK